MIKEQDEGGHDLSIRLDRSEQLTKRPRLVRFSSHPWRFVWPTILEKLDRTSAIRVRTFWGGSMNVVLPEPVSTTIWKYGFFEADVCRYLLATLSRGMTFIDVGAHFGFFTLLGSHLVGSEGQVLSFEPVPRSYRVLAQNAAETCPSQNVQHFNLAAYSESRDLVFADYGVKGSAFNSLLGIRQPDDEGTHALSIAVTGKAIDEVLRTHSGRVDLVKIDAELSEFHVLRGMEQTLCRFMPKLIVEVGDFGSAGSSTSREVVSWLCNLGYAPYEIRGALLVPHLPQVRYTYGNLLFAAPERQTSS